MASLGFPEIVIVLVAISILFFGGKKIAEFARGLGRFSGEVEKGKREVEDELKKVKGKLKA